MENKDEWVTCRVRISVRNRLMNKTNVGSFNDALNSILDMKEVKQEVVNVPIIPMELTEVKDVFVSKAHRSIHDEHHEEKIDTPIGVVAQYFIDHPEKNIDNYSDVQLKQLEYELKAKR